jgi:hypothetical protein
MRAKLLLGVFLSAACGLASAQTITASLEGVVKDPTGAVIVGARTVITNVETNIVTELSTDGDGRFLALSLPPGQYKVAVESAGFKRAERSGILLQVDRAARLDIAMELGAATETVAVAGEAPLIDSTSSAMGQ